MAFILLISHLQLFIWLKRKLNTKKKKKKSFTNCLFTCNKRHLKVFFTLKKKKTLKKYFYINDKWFRFIKLENTFSNKIYFNKS